MLKSKPPAKPANKTSGSQEKSQGQESKRARTGARDRKASEPGGKPGQEPAGGARDRRAREPGRQPGKRSQGQRRQRARGGARKTNEKLPHLPSEDP